MPLFVEAIAMLGCLQPVKSRGWKCCSKLYGNHRQHIRRFCHLLYVGHSHMANNESSAELNAKDFTEHRNDALREGVKGLFLMNGGSAVAMLAFLQAIWKENPQLAKYVIASIALFAVGVLLAGLVPFVKYHSSTYYQSSMYRAYRAFLFLYLAA